MTFRLGDRTRETTTTEGTGTIQLEGTLSGLQTFVDGVGSGNSTYYLVTNGTDWEVGIGTVTSGTPDSLSRDSVIASSAGGTTKVSFAEGTKDVMCVMPARKVVSKENGMEAGTELLPGLPFADDPDTGFYQPAANQIGATVGGVPVLLLEGGQITLLKKTRIQPGSAEAPGLSFDGDENTGLHQPAADQIALVVGGLIAMLVATGTVTMQQALAVANGLSVGGNAAINGGSITTSSTTGNVFNSVVTALNIGMAATNITIGATSGQTTVRNNFSVGGASQFQNITINGIGVQSNAPSLGNHLVNKTYADSKLALAGGTLSGFLSLHAVPTANFHATNKQWVESLFASGSVFSGAIVICPSTTIPSGWLLCNGQAVSRSTYAALFALIGTVFGPGDGSTTFNLPDFRGYFPRGFDGGRGIDIGRAFGSNQDDDLREHSHKNQSLHHDFKDGGPLDGQGLFKNWGDGNEDWDGEPVGGTETRPKNIAVNFIIKT